MKNFNTLQYFSFHETIFQFSWNNISVFMEQINGYTDYFLNKIFNDTVDTSTTDQSDMVFRIFNLRNASKTKRNILKTRSMRHENIIH